MAKMIKRIAGILGLQPDGEGNAGRAGRTSSASLVPHSLKTAQDDSRMLSKSLPSPQTDPPAPGAVNVAEGSVEVKNRLGLHMRPTTMVAKTAIKYLSTITIARDNKRASARSASSLERLKAKTGTRLNIRAEGPDAKDALKAVQALFDRKFGED
jgi:phosphocarrier protein HPr